MGEREAVAGEAHDAARAACLNCGARIDGRYCAFCGQKARIHRSLRSFFGDLFQGLFNFEGKIWRTLPMLAWCPGDLTRRYIAGERARFISPVALYLFTVVLMFAVLSFTGALSSDSGGGLNFNTVAKEERAALAKLEADRVTALRVTGDVATLDRRIADKKSDIALLQSGNIIKADPGDEVPVWLRGPVTAIQRDPKGAMANIQDATSKFSWLLIPLSVPFLWLLFPFSRRYRLFDHSVFVTYSLSFMMILVIVGGLLVWLGMTSAGGILTLIPPFHMYRQLKGAYGLRWYSALLRTTALVTFAFVAATFFAMAMVAIGIL